MPRFSTSNNAPVRAPWWDTGTLPDGTPWQEEVTLRPVLTRATVLAIRKAAVKPPPGMSAAEFDDADAATLLEYNDRLAGERALLEGMILSHTFRTDPTPEQTAAGLPGDIENGGQTDDYFFDNLPALDWAYLVNACNERAGSIAEQAKGETQSAADPLAASLPISSSSPSAAATSATSDPAHGDSPAIC